MKLFFWICLTLILMSYLGLPLVLSMIALVFKKKYERDSTFMPDASMIIPVHNEEGILEHKIENCLSLDYPHQKLEIIFALDGCTDNSRRIIEAKGKGEFTILDYPQRRGKMATLNAAYKQARNQIIIFGDADINFDRQAIKELVLFFKNKKIGCVGGQLNYLNATESSVEGGEHLYFKYEKFLRRKESQLGSLLVVSGSIYAMRRELIEDIDENLADDFVNPLRVLSRGFESVYAEEAMAFGKASNTVADEFSQRIRMTAQGLSGTLKEFKNIIGMGIFKRFLFFLHKFIRWLVPVLLIILIFTAAFLTEYSFYRQFLNAAGLFLLLGFCGFIMDKFNRRIMVFYIPFYFCLSNLAALLGIYAFLTGKQKGIWQRAQSTR